MTTPPDSGAIQRLEDGDYGELLEIIDDFSIDPHPMEKNPESQAVWRLIKQIVEFLRQGTSADGWRPIETAPRTGNDNIRCCIEWLEDAARECEENDPDVGIFSNYYMADFFKWLASVAKFEFTLNQAVQPLTNNQTALRGVHSV